MLNLNNKSLLITGGTGSFGKKFVEMTVKQFPNIRKLVVFSRDELKQFEMAQEFPNSKYPQIKFVIGDVRDKERLSRVLQGIDYVIHTAALKHVPIAEQNPIECIKTNIMGAEHVIEACLENKVERVVALSSDKAANPISLYGATKLCSDKLFIAANHLKGEADTRFTVVRFGNFTGSRGSILKLFRDRRTSGVLPITHPEVSRFNISLEESVNTVLFALEHGWGGELFVPKLASFKVADLAKAVAPECKHQIIGLRPGEKLHEDMITSNDSFSTYELKDQYVILPSIPSWSTEEWTKTFKAKKVADGFHYSSDNNPTWLSVEDLKKEIEHI